MSSVRTAGLFEFHNIGDLTTTFTAPTSCPSTGIAYQGVEAPGLPGQMMFGVGSCSSADWDAQCTPNGDAAKTLYKSVADNTSATKAYYDFHSPGLACPSAWETAGIVSFNGSSVDASGVFASTVFQYFSDETTALPRWNFALNALTSVLEPTETAIVCCPSGFTAHPIAGCYSSIDVSEVAGSTGCAQLQQAWGDFTTTTETFEYFGQTVTYESARLVTPTSGTAEEGHETTQTLSFTLDENGFPDNTELPYSQATGEALQGLEYVSFVWLVNSGEEVQDGDGGEDISDGKSKGGSDEGGDDENGAETVRAGSFTTVGGVAALWAASFLAVCSL